MQYLKGKCNPFRLFIPLFKVPQQAYEDEMFKYYMTDIDFLLKEIFRLEPNTKIDLSSLTQFPN